MLKSTFIGCDKKYPESDIVIFGAPFDGTTSYRPGTRFAAKAIRAESFGIETYSPYQQKDLEDIKVCDIGDLELPFGNTKKVLDLISEKSFEILNDDKIPVMIGGEHLVTLGAVNSVIKKYPNVYIIHFDAHADLRDDYLGESLSHATVMRRIWESLSEVNSTDKIRIYQLGIRSGDREEFEFAKSHVYTCMYDCSGIDYVVESLKNQPVYLSIDLDILDPSVFPGTGTPEPGGVSFTTLLESILKLKDLNIVAADINELSPPYDPSGVSTAVACKILRELLLIL